MICCCCLQRYFLLNSYYLARNRIWKTNPKFNPPEAETFSFGLSETEFPKEKPKTLIPPLFTIRRATSSVRVMEELSQPG